jgi:hypothetical protein
MKNILYLLVLSCFISLMTVSCEIDNYNKPDAQISGKFSDAVGGALVGTDISNGNSIGVYELGWPTEAKQTWNIKNTGEYTNNLVFAAKYRFEFTSCNFYPFIENDVVLNKGANTHDFTVTPYLRLKNPTITYDAATKIVTATFSIEKGGTDNILMKEYRLFAFSDQWVGNYVKFAISNAACYKTGLSVVPDGTTVYTLTMDVAANATLFKFTRDYYFRIGALATVPASVANAGTVRYNYSPLVTLNIVR